MQHCDKHLFDEAVAVCADCRDQLCDTCVVPVKKIQLCMPCALVRSGVRHRGSALGRVFARSR
jgi:hypothetical protein